jgi:hypothetical protein
MLSSRDGRYIDQGACAQTSMIGLHYYLYVENLDATGGLIIGKRLITAKEQAFSRRDSISAT